MSEAIKFEYTSWPNPYATLVKNKIRSISTRISARTLPITDLSDEKNIVCTATITPSMMLVDGVTTECDIRIPVSGSGKLVEAGYDRECFYYKLGNTAKISDELPHIVVDLTHQVSRHMRRVVDKYGIACIVIQDRFVQSTVMDRFGFVIAHNDLIAHPIYGLGKVRMTENRPDTIELTWATQIADGHYTDRLATDPKVFTRICRESTIVGTRLEHITDPRTNTWVNATSLLLNDKSHHQWCVYATYTKEELLERLDLKTYIFDSGNRWI